MPRANYPSASDLERFLNGIGVYSKTGSLAFLDLAGNCLTAAQRFEGETGRTFIAQQQTRVFDPPIQSGKGILDLQGDLYSGSGQNLVIAINGAQQVNGSDYYLRPFNANNMGRPWSMIEFNKFFPSPYVPYQRQSVTVSGLWGYSLLIPDDAWDAMLRLAAWLCYPEIALSISQGLASYQVDGVGENYSRGRDAGPLANEAAAWMQTVERQRKNYYRVTGFFG